MIPEMLPAKFFLQRGIGLENLDFTEIDAVKAMLPEKRKQNESILKF